jgi:hypothetical protein
MGANVKYVGERTGRYDRYERVTRKNADRWMIPQPVKRRTNRWYTEPVRENWYWPGVIGITFLFGLFFVWAWYITC